MSFQPFHPLKKDVPKLTRRKSKKVREDLIPSSFDSEFGNFKSSRKNFTLFELQDATDDFSHGRDKRLVKSLVVGRPILLALEDIDGGPSFLEKALRFLEKYRTKVKGILKQLADVEEVDRIVQEYEQGKVEPLICRLIVFNAFAMTYETKELLFRVNPHPSRPSENNTVVESPVESALIPDGAPLLAY
ncbi:uncharacterized protein [Arachis hypogaea]|uniref:uncharacterized protein isoform X2 n=1 Tax=Arachis hypogaea TaxID=3818 RepID=UPI003B21A204|nr:Rho GTPase-activating protein [Arachis hypogaea]